MSQINESNSFDILFNLVIKLDKKTKELQKQIIDLKNELDIHNYDLKILSNSAHELSEKGE